jgi:DNA-binding IclR family transcriptional regulator
MDQARTPRAGSYPRVNKAPSGTQSIQRAARLLRELAARNRQGMRLIDIAQSSGLQRPTVHRMLKCLTAENLVSQDPQSRRYFLGPLVFELGITAGPRFNIRDLCSDALDRIAAETGDTVFLTIRSGDACAGRWASVPAVWRYSPRCRTRKSRRRSSASPIGFPPTGVSRQPS